MGKAAKGSRKGKKAWRTNISTADIEDYFEKATRDSLSGASSLPSLPDSSLFFLHTSNDHHGDPNHEPSLQRKTEKHREKPLRHETLLQKNPFVQPVPPSDAKKSKKRKTKHVPEQIMTAQAVSSKADDDSDTLNFDIWDEDGNKEAHIKKRPTTTTIPAVEIEPLGCSFNPPFEAHQDALAKAVADEMQKLYKKELGPEPVPRTVTGEAVPDDEKFFLDTCDGNESNEEDTNQALDLPSQRKSKTKRVTRVEQNRRVRRKELLKTEAEAKKIENLSKQIDSLPDIMKEIEKEDEEKERRHTRRVVAKQERLKTLPPRLGKSKFVPAPAQVLLTEEITGSLRKLKGCCTLARDRFKSLEKRALIVPRSNKRSRRN